MAFFATASLLGRLLDEENHIWHVPSEVLGALGIGRHSPLERGLSQPYDTCLTPASSSAG